MKNTFIKSYKTLTYNFKTLFYFEIIYRLFGILVIFPLSRILISLSIRLSGFVYITNKMLMEYFKKPSTILILFVLLILLSIYMVIEMIYLSILYDFGYNEKEINLKSFLILGFRKVTYTIKRYHFFVIFPAFLFFILVELLHIVGIVSTISLPQYFLEEIRSVPVLSFVTYSFGILLVVLFIELIFTFNLFTLDKLSLKIGFEERKKLLNKKRFKMFIEFIILNLILNIVLYVIYLLIIAIIGILISMIKGHELVLGIILTILYTIYLVVVFLGSIILIPINYALVSSWYYDSKETLKMNVYIPTIQNYKKPIKIKRIKRSVIVVIILIFFLNVTSVFAVLRQSNNRVELFKYSQIIAHRGASSDAPENTIAAIELAIEQGANIIEIDVRETKDLYPVLLHDATLGRTTNDNQNRSVALVNLDTIKSLDAGFWFSSKYEGEKIPTLEEALNIIKGRSRVLIELKTNSSTLEENVVKIIEKLKMVEDVEIMSFNRNQLTAIKILNPQIETVLLAATFYGDLNALVKNPDIDNFSFQSSIIIKNPQYVQTIHQFEKKVYAWTANNENKIIGVVENDVDGIITDVPILAREIAYSKNKKSLLSNLLKELFSR